MNWDEIPDGLRDLLISLYDAHGPNPTLAVVADIRDWLDENLEGCSATVFHGSLEEPPEYCDAKALPGSEFCGRHDG